MSTNPIPLIYIAGPLAAANPLSVRRNIEAARDLGLRVAECGAYPVIPHTNTGEFFGLLNEETLWRPGALALLQRCDGIVLTHTWEKSIGARGEHDWARQHGLPSYTDVDPTQAYIMGRQWPLQQFVDEVRRGLASKVAWPNRIAPEHV